MIWTCYNWKDYGVIYITTMRLMIYRWNMWRIDAKHVLMLELCMLLEDVWMDWLMICLILLIIIYLIMDIWYWCWDLYLVDWILNLNAWKWVGDVNFELGDENGVESCIFEFFFNFFIFFSPFLVPRRTIFSALAQVRHKLPIFFF